MKKYLLSLLIFIFCQTFCFGQSYFEMDCPNNPSGNTESLLGITLAPNGSVIAIGQTGSTYNEKIPMISVDTATGNVNWTHIITGTRLYGEHVCAVSDGVVVCGEKVVNYINVSGIVYKIDVNGNILWAREFPGALKYALNIKPTTGNGVVVVGKQDTAHASWMAKLDANGNVLWQKSFRFSANENSFQDVILTHDNGYLGFGYAICPTCPPSMPYKCSVAKTDSNGAVLWSKTFNLPDGCAYTGGTETHDHGFVLAGWIGNSSTLTNDSITECLFLQKIDSTGNMEWSRYYPMGAFFLYGNVAESQNHQLVVTGTSSNYMGQDHGCVIVTDFQGMPLLNTALYKTNGNFISSSVLTPSGTLFCAGNNKVLPYNMNITKRAYYFSSGCDDSTFSITSFSLPLTEGNSAVVNTTFNDNPITLVDSTFSRTHNVCFSTGIKENQIVNRAIKIMPQPANDYADIILQSPSQEQNVVRLFNISGNEIRKYDLSAGNSELRIERNLLPEGIYFVQITNSKGEIIANGKILFAD